jgi:hypothetical protein
MSTVKVEGLEEVQAILGLIPKKARFAASIGMNRTINEAQDKIKAGLSDKFTLRRKAFIEGTIYRKPREDWANREHLEARVRVRDDRDFLAKHEDGGLKTPSQGRKALAIPLNVKRLKSEIISKANRPAALLASGKAFIRNGKIWQRVGRGKSAKLVAAYGLAPSARIRPTLRFEETGREVVARRAVPNIVGAIEKELSTGLTSKSVPMGGGVS